MGIAAISQNKSQSYLKLLTDYEQIFFTVVVVVGSTVAFQIANFVV